MATESGEVNEYTDEYGRKFEGQGLTMVDKITAKDFMIATQVFEVQVRERDEIDSASGSEDDGSATSANTSIGFKDGTVKVLTQLNLLQGVSLEAFDGGRQEKEEADKAKAKAREEAEKKAKAKDDREG